MRTLRTRFGASLVVALAATSVACTGAKPSREDCDQFTEHFEELLKQKKDPEGRQFKKMSLKQQERILELCTGKGTKAEVVCALEQDSLEAIAENCK